MSAYKAVWINCDECGDPSNVEVGGAADNVRDARDDARRQGWVRRAGRDLCEHCKVRP